jgi:hypothetical protein
MDDRKIIFTPPKTYSVVNVQNEHDLMRYIEEFALGMIQKDRLKRAIKSLIENTKRVEGHRAFDRGYSRGRVDGYNEKDGWRT